MFVFRPLHTEETVIQSVAYKKSAIDFDFCENQLVYIDPPYNHEQYSSHYFPLNIVCDPNIELKSNQTGRMKNAYRTPFSLVTNCKEAFLELFKRIKGPFILSYNSQGTLSLQEMKDTIAEAGKTVKNVTIKDQKSYSPRRNSKSLSRRRVLLKTSLLLQPYQHYNYFFNKIAILNSYWLIIVTLVKPAFFCIFLGS